MTWHTKIRSYVRTERPMVRIFLAETLGMFILIAFALSCVVQSVVSGGTMGNYVSITIACGIAVMMGVTAAIGVSGGHINPAVTVSMALTKNIRWSDIPAYWLGQYVGSFLGAVFVYCIYYEAILAYDPNRTVTGPTATAFLFVTFPHTNISTRGTFIDQVLGTAILLIGVHALIDQRNVSLNKTQLPIYVALLVMLLGNALGYNCGYPVNPARDLSPRIFIWLAGWGNEAFSYRNYWFWVPIIGPHTGAVLGTLVYQLFITNHWPEEPKPEIAAEFEESPEKEKQQINWAADIDTETTLDEISKF